MPTHPSYTPAHGAQPLVSFIVPTYNLPVDMLRESLDSIMDLSLTQEEREIIVIDDGSINSPLAALADVIDQIIYIRQPNKERLRHATRDWASPRADTSSLSMATTV